MWLELVLEDERLRARTGTGISQRSLGAGRERRQEPHSWLSGAWEVDSWGDGQVQSELSAPLCPAAPFSCDHAYFPCCVLEGLGASAPRGWGASRPWLWPA